MKIVALVLIAIIVFLPMSYAQQPDKTLATSGTNNSTTLPQTQHVGSIINSSDKKESKETGKKRPTCG